MLLVHFFMIGHEVCVLIILFMHRVLWIFGGTVFYALLKDLTIANAFYTSMSVGYAIFWVELNYSAPSVVFTVCHMLVGYIATAVVMAVFAVSLTDNKDGW